MRIGILGCDAIRNEIEMVTANDPDVVYREYLEFGLHLHPDDLKSTILRKLESLPVEVDALFLGYGHCQALKDSRCRRVCQRSCWNTKIALRP